VGTFSKSRLAESSGVEFRDAERRWAQHAQQPYRRRRSATSATQTTPLCSAWLTRGSKSDRSTTSAWTS